MKQTLSGVACIIFLLSCSTPKDVTMIENNTETEVPSTSGDAETITAPVVTKNFVAKNGKVTDHLEFYIRQSIQDYFIKFCESGVSREELETYLNELDGEIKTLTMVVEIRDGEWDQCDEDFEVQSRIGEYMVIHSIVEN